MNRFKSRRDTSLLCLKLRNIINQLYMRTILVKLYDGKIVVYKTDEKELHLGSEVKITPPNGRPRLGVVEQLETEIYVQNRFKIIAGQVRSLIEEDLSNIKSGEEFPEPHMED